MTTTPNLTDFLLARIAEDEGEIGAEIFGHDDSAGPNGIGWAEVGAINEVLISSHRRVLAECEAKRRIVELHPPQRRREWDECAVCFDPDTAPGYYDFEAWPCSTLQALALPYADHPDYREEWRP